MCGWSTCAARAPISAPAATWREFASKGEALGDFLREVTAYLQVAIGALIRLKAIVVTEVARLCGGRRRGSASSAPPTS